MKGTAMQASVNKEVQFDAGHRVPSHASKCRNPHGHRYRVVAYCVGEVVDDLGSADDGMVVDFGDLKRWLTELVHDRFDHGFIVQNTDPLGPALARVGVGTGEPWKIVTVTYPPTAECLAADIFATLAPVIDAHWRGNMRLSRIDVWETPTSCATVTA